MSEKKTAKIAIKAVIFDLSNTIVDTKLLDREAMDAILKQFSQPSWAEIKEQGKKDPKKSMKGNFPNFFGEKNADAAYKAYIDYLLKNRKKMPLFNGAKETLILLHANNISVIIVSNRDRSFADDLLNYHGLDPYICKVIAAGDTAYTKPNPAIVYEVLRGTEIKPSEILFVGDARADIECALQSGCIPILLTERQTDVTPEYLQSKAGQLSCVKNHTELQRFIMENCLCVNRPETSKLSSIFASSQPIETKTQSLSSNLLCLVL